jgi:hypothetical protein
MMNLKNERTAFAKENDTQTYAETEFHTVFGWLAAVSVSIATAALAIIT